MTQENLTWNVMGASVTGSSHAFSKKPNQDAIDWQREEGRDLPLVLAIADGHGSNTNFRSDIGAKFAVATALEELLLFGQKMSNISHPAVLKDAYEKVPQNIVRRWSEKVKEHWVANPPVGEEWKYLNQKEQSNILRRAMENHTLPYGSTLLAALVTNTFLLLMQLGDGDIVLVFDNGEIEKPIPPDSRLFANGTTSLCTSTAANDFQRQFRLVNRMPALVLLSTDGYSNSFNNEAGFLKVGQDIWGMMRAEGGRERVKTSLQEWLQEATKTGSGDDITLGILSAPELLKKELLEKKKEGDASLAQDAGGEVLAPEVFDNEQAKSEDENTHTDLSQERQNITEQQDSLPAQTVIKPERIPEQRVRQENMSPRRRNDNADDDATQLISDSSKQFKYPSTYSNLDTDK